MAMMRAIGLMSGTSLDGVDIALIETDGERVRWGRPDIAATPRTRRRSCVGRQRTPNPFSIPRTGPDACRRRRPS
jgi:1,6-anhydro-N-acetylmuramate kinase